MLLVDALLELNALFSECSETYNTIVWIDNNNTISEEVVNNKILELTAGLPMKVLRRERNIKLNDTDKYTSIPDWPHTTEEIKQSWLDYRQTLRNLPSNSSPQLDDNGELINVNWPIPPS